MKKFGQMNINRELDIKRQKHWISTNKKYTKDKILTFNEFLDSIATNTLVYIEMDDNDDDFEINYPDILSDNTIRVGGYDCDMTEEILTSLDSKMENLSNCEDNYFKIYSIKLL